VTPRSIQHVLRALADSCPRESDAELLRRFLANDERAFAEVVRRHGRLVWAVCRHLTRSDAEADDAFQATFLVLLKNAGKVRDARKLSAWLHGVAYKVCAKSRLAAKRRDARERATAAREGDGGAVPDSAWDRALAAVHEEVAKLPETLRVPFVLCCLEGVGVTEAAGRLGWKLGTLSGRLTRAKDAVLAKLEARGLTPGIVASVGVVTVPATVTAKAAALARLGSTVPGPILQLSQGVLGMSMRSVKVLAAAVMLTCGLGWGVGTGWVATADAQTAGRPAEKPDPRDEVSRLRAELEKAQKVAEFERAQKAAEVAQAVDKMSRWWGDTLPGRAASETATFTTAKWAYDLVEVSDMNQKMFQEFLQDRENRGWEYNGTTVLKREHPLVWVFRRPLKAAGGSSASSTGRGDFTGSTSAESRAAGKTLSTTPTKAESYAPRRPGTGDDAKSVEAEIKQLQAKLAAIKQGSAARRTVVIDYAGLTDGGALAKVLVDLGEKKFGKGSIRIADESGKLIVSGTEEMAEWAAALAQKLTGK
jgi:RNA polymerase sigma factor (sigma-70 family)